MNNTGHSSEIITVRYFAGARAASGTESQTLPVSGTTSLESLAERLAAEHGPRLARVLEAASFLIDEVTGDRSRVVPVGAVVDVLPPFAGG